MAVGLKILLENKMVVHTINTRLENLLSGVMKMTQDTYRKMYNNVDELRYESNAVGDLYSNRVLPQASNSYGTMVEYRRVI